jgi:hypothetical protein
MLPDDPGQAKVTSIAKENTIGTEIFGSKIGENWGRSCEVKRELAAADSKYCRQQVRL